MLNEYSIGNCHFSYFDSCNFCLKLEAAVSQAVISDCHLEEALSYRLRTSMMVPPTKPYWCHCVLAGSAHVCAHLHIYHAFSTSDFFLTSYTGSENLASFLWGMVGRALENDLFWFCLFHRHILDLMKLAVTFNLFFKQISNMDLLLSCCTYQW